MKSAITLVPTKDMTKEDWLRYRKQGVGASETGIILGLSPYKASIELFYDKIGESLGLNLPSLAAFLGKEQESFMATLWEHWDGSVEGMMANYETGNRVRRCRRVNAYAHNPDYPWLFASLDREILKHPGQTTTGTLELKTIGGWEADKWEGGIPPSHIIQVQTQMLVCRMTYGEIAIMRDNRDFSVLPFEFSQTIADTIIERTHDFWKRVEQARILLTRRFEAQRAYNGQAVDELNAQLQTLEPEPDGSEAFNNFLKEKYKIALPGERKGTAKQLQSALAHKELSGRIKELAEQKQLHENILKSDIRDGCDRLDFGPNGYTSWKADTNGIRRFLNKAK